jgi:hypothetical protein
MFSAWADIPAAPDHIALIMAFSPSPPSIQ